MSKDGVAIDVGIASAIRTTSVKRTIPGAGAGPELARPEMYSLRTRRIDTGGIPRVDKASPEEVLPDRRADTDHGARTPRQPSLHAKSEGKGDAKDATSGPCVSGEAGDPPRPVKHSTSGTRIGILPRPIHRDPSLGWHGYGCPMLSTCLLYTSPSPRDRG